MRYKIVFQNKPRRVFYVRADDALAAFNMARYIEVLLERPIASRDRSLDQAIIDALQSEDES